MLFLCQDDIMKNEEPFNIHMNSRYSLLETSKGAGVEEVFHSYPVNKKPSIDDLNYDNDFFLRYFTQKCTSEKFTIYEIDLKQYEIFKKNPFYKTVSVIWKIKGEIDTITDEKGERELGVYEFNLNQVRKTQKIINGISLVLNNPLEFYSKI